MDAQHSGEEKTVHQGKNAKYFRLKGSWTQESFAADLTDALNNNKETLFKSISYKTIPQQYVSQWEKMETLPADALALILHVLDLGPKWITDSIHYEGQNNTYYQEGENNNNIQTTDQVHYTENHPIDAIERVHKETMAKMSELYYDSQTRAEKQHQEVRDLYDQNIDRLEKFNLLLLEKLEK